MSQNISFISEAVIEEKRKERQEQWEKTRTENDPIEAPEEKYDPRTLYERLQEQKLKKQEAFEESRKLKNLIKGLDNDEIEFLNIIDSNKAELENQKFQEELLALEEYKRAVVDLNTEEQEKKLLEFKRELFQMHKKKVENSTKGKKSQAELLLGAIKRKSQKDDSQDIKKLKKDSNKGETSQQTTNNDNTNNTDNLTEKIKQKKLPTIQCIGKLPGIGCYDDNSDSCDSDRDSNESDVEDFTAFPLQTK